MYRKDPDTPPWLLPLAVGLFAFAASLGLILALAKAQGGD